MISNSQAFKQFNRLSDYESFNRLTKEARQDYIWAIQVAATEAIATRVIDDIKAEELREQIPTSAYIRRKMNEENDRGKLSPALDDVERWKAEETSDPHPIDRMSGGTGIWKKGRFPKLDRHLELLDMRVRLKNKMPESLLEELRRLTDELRVEDAS
jgi:hypothetical protein